MKMKSPIRNQKGLALITTLMMMVLALGVVAILLVLTTRATKLTGLQQGYTTAQNAASAGADVFINTVLNCNTSLGQCTPPSFVTNQSPGCLNAKIFDNTSVWNANGNTFCTQGAAASTSDATQHPDITWAAGHYQVYVKIIDTYLMGAANANDPACNTPSGCNFYTVVSTAKGPSDTATVQFIYRVAH